MNTDAPLTPVYHVDLNEEVARSIRTLIAAATTGKHTAEPVASFLLAWYDAQTYGGFNLQDIWLMDEPARKAAATLFAWLSKTYAKPKDLDLDLVFKIISDRWAS